MSVRQLKALAADSFEPVGGTINRCVLLVLADIACDSCGLTWLGVKKIAKRCELSENRAREALHHLVALNIIAVNHYAKGGRGRAAEIVVQAVRNVIPAPCEGCVERRKAHLNGGRHT